MQRHAAAAVVVDLEPALFDDAAAARVEGVECGGNAVGGHHVALAGFDHGGGLVARVAQVGDGAERMLAVIRGRGVEQHVAAGHAGFHLDDFLALDVEVPGDDVDFLLGQGVAMGEGVVHVGAGLEALLLAAQVEEQLALRLGRGDLDHAPVLEDVLVDLGLDPVHGIAHEPHALRGIEAAHGLHEADVAFLDQVALRQAIAQVLARDGHHQAQMRHDEATCCVEVVVVPQLAGVFGFLLGGEHGHAVDCRDVGVEIAERGNSRHCRPVGGKGEVMGSGGRNSLFGHRSFTPFERLDTSDQERFPEKAGIKANTVPVLGCGPFAKEAQASCASMIGHRIVFRDGNTPLSGAMETACGKL